MYSHFTIFVYVKFFLLLAFFQKVAFRAWECIRVERVGGTEVRMIFKDRWSHFVPPPVRLSVFDCYFCVFMCSGLPPIWALWLKNYFIDGCACAFALCSCSCLHLCSLWSSGGVVSEGVGILFISAPFSATCSAKYKHSATLQRRGVCTPNSDCKIIGYTPYTCVHPALRPCSEAFFRW